MRPIPDDVVERDPQRHALLVAWIEASNALRAAILQRDEVEIAEKLKEHEERLDAYLAAVRGSPAVQWNGGGSVRPLSQAIPGTLNDSAFGCYAAE